MRILFLSFVFLTTAFNIFALGIKSSVFNNGGYLPDRYTCDSLNVSPPLQFDDIPKSTKSLVLICDDPDAPMGTWVHWVVYNIAPSTTKLLEGVVKEKALPDGALQGVNDFAEVGYGGACPPNEKPHRYFFKLYALNQSLALEKGATKRDVEKAMTGHIIQEAKICGLYRH